AARLCDSAASARSSSDMDHGRRARVPPIATPGAGEGAVPTDARPSIESAHERPPAGCGPARLAGGAVSVDVTAEADAGGESAAGAGAGAGGGGEEGGSRWGAVLFDAGSFAASASRAMPMARALA